MTWKILELGYGLRAANEDNGFDSWIFGLMETNPGLRLRPIERGNLSDYADFLRGIFQKSHFSADYLEWLYFQNPNGDVVGYDAYFADKLVGHYACIPIKLDTYQLPALLSLNTAVSQEFQGKGLFKSLAMKTYDSNTSNYSCVIGVANRKSFRGFTRHLGFEHLGELDLRIGGIKRKQNGQRTYTSNELNWRSRNPAGYLTAKTSKSECHAVVTRKIFAIFNLKSLVKMERSDGKCGCSGGLDHLGITVDWRLGMSPKFSLPKRFKPSPLHLIFKPMAEEKCLLTSWSFPDFDAL